MENLLSITTFIPLLAAAILAVFLRGDDEQARTNAKWVAMLATLATFLVSLFILFGFDPADTGFQFVEERTWLAGLTYKMGVDGISVLFVMLTTFLMPLVIWSAWDVKVRVKEYMIAFLLLETLMLGVFMALDLVLFYLFFEAGLIPMFLIIGIWGGKDRIYAAFKFFLYTFLGSVLMLVAMVGMFADATSNRQAAGASYWGIMEMSGNLWEPVVTIGNSQGRAYTGIHGDGFLSAAGFANCNFWPSRVNSEVLLSDGMGLRGSAWDGGGSTAAVSDRTAGSRILTGRDGTLGCRGVRTMP